MSKIQVQNDIATQTERDATQDEAMLAVGKTLTDTRIKAIRDTLNPSVVELNHTVQVQGELVIHADYEQTQVNKVCPWTFLRVAWDKMNTNTRNACVQEVQQMLREEVKPDLKELKAVTKDAVDAVKGQIKQINKGPCKFNGVIWVTE